MPKNCRKSGRGVNANELFNFSYDPPSSSSGHGSHRPRPVYRDPSKNDPEASKRVYMLENFQFVIRPDVLEKNSVQLPQVQKKLKQSLKSSDLLPPWSAVCAVVVRKPVDDFQCPLCLEIPTAAYVTECGHIYCLPCILHYLQHLRSQEKQRQCPVCFGVVVPSELRPCILNPVETPRVGALFRCTRLSREGSASTLLRTDDPRLDELKNLGVDDVLLPTYGDPSATYNRFILPGADMEASTKQSNISAVQERLESTECEPRPFTKYVFDERQALIEAVRMMTDKTVGWSSSSGASTPARRTPTLAPGGGDAANGKRMYDVYGESEGQPFYMHSVNVRMLRHDAEVRGNTEPETSVVAPVIDVESFTQCEESRRKFKAFSHIPLQGSVNYCFVDLSDVVLPETMEFFKGTLARYDQLRAEKKSLEDVESSEKDVTWQEYLNRYRQRRGPSSSESRAANQSPCIANQSPWTGCSTHSFNSEMLPSLDLPPARTDSLDGSPAVESSLDSRQRATKQQTHEENVQNNRWLTGKLSFSNTATFSNARSTDETSMSPIAIGAAWDNRFPTLEDAAKRHAKR